MGNEASHTVGLTPAEAAAELLRRRRARESLLGYCEYVAIPGDPGGRDDAEDESGAESDPGEGVKFPPVGSSLALHHRVLCEKIQSTMDKRYGRLMVFMPPGAAKSTYCSVVAPTWEMGRKPGSRIILAMHTGEIAKKQGRKARSIIRQRAYLDVFSDKGGLSKETSAADMWMLDNGSEYMAAGIRSGISGNRASGLIVDDPIRGRKDAESPQIRADTLAAWEDDLGTRLMPGAWIILVQTRWHAADLAGSLLPDDYEGQSGPVLCKDGMVWEVLNIPAEAERDDDVLGRPKGGMLWPEWFDPEHWIAPRKKKRTWSALYQQRPVLEEGAQFQREWFDNNRYDPQRSLPPLNKFTTSDYATTEEDEADDPDYTVHIAWGRSPDGHIYALGRFKQKCNTEVGIRALLNLAKRHVITRGFGEVGVIRRAIEPAFKFWKRKDKINLSIAYLPHIGSKSVAGLSFQALASGGMVHFPSGVPWADEVIDNLVGFPSLDHDDEADCCFLAGRAVDDVAWANLPPEEEVDTSLKPFTWKWLIHGTDKPPPEPGKRVF